MKEKWYNKPITWKKLFGMGMISFVLGIIHLACWVYPKTISKVFGVIRDFIKNKFKK